MDDIVKRISIRVNLEPWLLVKESVFVDIVSLRCLFVVYLLTPVYTERILPLLAWLLLEEKE
ncbi:hypothetical protein C8I07_05005 [Shewanella baltica]|nr:hypothetical protein C8I07_05005 [Shewanella baltica]